MKNHSKTQFRQNMRYFFASLIIISLLGGAKILHSETKKAEPPVTVSKHSLISGLYLAWAVADFEPPMLPVGSEVNGLVRLPALGYGSTARRKPKSSLERKTNVVTVPTKPSFPDPSLSSNLKKQRKQKDLILSPLKKNGVTRRFSSF